ncbi:bacteriophage-like protein [Devosia soli]|uniref:Bacteriophage-like protein n=1 Tax=Devosia soli TaxID=361041 RepID=A0A0F5LC10_9HYPH|nr:hypothetical protein [Devosia soli]KKB79724.1 bacteriophage-like protein [Devosia soli]
MSTEQRERASSTFTVSVPLTIRTRGGRKLVLSPAGGAITAPARPRIDNTLVKALARAFRWRKILESGRFATVAEMAAAENMDRSYVSRVMRMTLLAPEIVESILEGRHSPDLLLPKLLEPRSEIWSEQRLS